MSDLSEFLRARLNEDEQVAIQAAGRDWPDWSYDRDNFRVTMDNPPSDSAPWVAADKTGDAGGLHIARHDPARVLADVEATRLIVGMYEDACHRAEHGPNADAVASARVARATLQGVLTVLAGAYAGHPDYPEEWALA